MKQVRVDANGAAITGFGNSGDGRLISRVNEGSAAQMVPSSTP